MRSMRGSARPPSTAGRYAVSSSSPSSAAVAGRPASRAQLEAAGFQLKLNLHDAELFHLFRRRPVAEFRRRVLKETSASHIVGDDLLCPSEGRGAVPSVDLWKVNAKFAWATPSAPHPMVLYPEQLGRMKERVAWELAHNPAAAAVSLLLQVPRETLDQADDWTKFAALANPTLLNWGPGTRVSGVIGFMDPVPLLHFPAGSKVIPPVEWQRTVVPATFAAVAVTISRQEPFSSTSSSVSPSPGFRRVGAHAPLKDLKTKARAGLVRVMVEIDLLQRPHPARMSLASFGRRAVADLLAKLPSSGGYPSLPLQGLRQQNDMLSGFVDLPDATAAGVIRASGNVRGVFARPWMPGNSGFSCPSTFTATSHWVLRVKVSRFSDVIYTALTEADIPFDGLVCPRYRGEMGIRLPAGQDGSAVTKCLVDGFSAVAKSGSSRRVTFRATNVPLSILDKLPHLVSRLDADLQLVSSRVAWFTSPLFAVVDLEVSSPDPVGDDASWQLLDLGIRPVVVKRLPPRRPQLPIQVLSPGDPLPRPRQPLTREQQLSWAERARGSGPLTPTPSASATPSVSRGPAASTLPVTAATAVIPEDAEIPTQRLRARAQRAKQCPAPNAPLKRQQPANRAPPLSSAVASTEQARASPPKITPRRSVVITDFVAPRVISDPPAVAPGGDSTLLQSLVSQVASLNEALQSQQAILLKLQEDLRTALVENAALRAQVRDLSKRRRPARPVAESPALEGGLESEVSMSSEDVQASQRRKSPGRESPTH